MLNDIFKGVFDTETVSVVAVSDFLLCLFCALAVGFILALMYMYKNRYSRSFIVTLALLPAAVSVVIMMVNGNVGTGVAVAGAFSLVRFRSIPGTAREIGIIFLAMGAGLVVGMGYLAYAFLFVIILGSISMLYNQLDFGVKKQMNLNKTLRITIPEDLDYPNIFKDLLEEYTRAYQLVNVKTTSMGSLFKLTYQLTFKEEGREKELIDELRCRNGNLEITMSTQESVAAEL